MSHDLPEEQYPTESEIECPRCGEVFFYELNRCPNCGLSVYPAEEEAEDEDVQPWGVDPGRDSLEEWFETLGPAAAIFAGLFVSFLAATILFFAVRSIAADLVQDWPGRGLLLLTVPIGAAIGGLTGALLHAERPRRIGWWVGGLSIIAVVVFAGVDRDLSATGWLGLDTLPFAVLTVLSGAAGGEFYRRRQRDVVVRELFLDQPGEPDLFDELMARTGRDPERAERLIDHERYYMPNANRRTLIESALRRLDRDNR